MKYADAGVNIDLGDDVSKMLYNAAKQTWSNRKGQLGEVIVPFDDFSGVRAIDVSQLPKGTLMNISFDGIGTKTEIAERSRNHRTMAYDLFAMVCDDAVVRGAEPVLVGSILDVRSLKGTDETPFLDEVRQLAQGYIEAANAANVAVVNGEVAELGSRVSGYGEFNYNWGAAVVWFAHKDRIFTGKEIQEGDMLVGLREHGFRSNGLSLVRKVMLAHHGPEWHQVTLKKDGTLADLVLKPSCIYTKAAVEMFGGYYNEPKANVHGIVHITGGGLPGKLGRVLKPSGLGAMIDNPFLPSEFMLYVQAQGNISDREAYRTWNMGQGMVIITPEPDAVIAVAHSYEIESQVIGRITSTTGIRIVNKGAFVETNREPEMIFV